MFKRIFNNNFKYFGIRRFSNNNNNNKMVEEHYLIRKALQGVVVSLCGLNFVIAFKK